MFSNSLQLPGVRFAPRARTAAARTRLDVPGFVGFAARGPLDRPVRVASFDEFEAIFGGRMELARDADGEALIAHLHGSVATFFDQGGRAAWIVRVAGAGARAAWCNLPGLVFLDGDRCVGAVVEAAWPGAWGSGLRCQVQGEFEPLDPAGLAVDDAGGLVYAGEHADRIADGSTLLLRADGAEEDYVCVLGTDLRPEAVLLDRRPVVGEAVAVQAVLLGAGRIALGEAILRGGDGWELTFPSAPAQPVAAGDVLSLATAGGADLLLTADAGSPESGGPWSLRASTVLERVDGLPPGAAIGQLRRFAVTVSVYDEDRAVARIDSADLAPASERYLGWRMLAESAGADGPVELDRGAAAGAWRAWLAADEPPPVDEPLEPLDRRQLAGRLAPLSTIASVEGVHPRREAPVCLPVGVLSAALREVRGRAWCAGDDGLERFPATSFFDPSLATTPAAALLRSADAQRFTWGRRLLGLHSLLAVREVALVALPDAVQPQWEDQVVFLSGADLSDEPAAPPEVDPAAGCPSDFVDCVDLAEESDGDPADSTAIQSIVERVATAVDEPALIRIHALAAAMAEARGDLIAVLALPRGTDLEDVRRLRRGLRQARGLAAGGMGGESARQIADLGLAVLAHPWLVAPDPSGRGGRVLPPDGALCGVLARREATGGPWLSPGHQHLRGALGIEPRFDRAGLEQLVHEQILALDQRAGEVAFVSGATQADLARLLPIGVRRLLQFIRRECERLGERWVFEPNGWELERDVRSTLVDLLEGVAQRGGLASTVPGEGFELSVHGASDPSRAERGELVVVLRVAPAYPLEFIEIRLVRSGDETSWTVTEG